MLTCLSLKNLLLVSVLQFRLTSHGLFESVKKGFRLPFSLDDMKHDSTARGTSYHARIGNISDEPLICRSTVYLDTFVLLKHMHTLYIKI